MSYSEKDMGDETTESEIIKVNPHREFIVKRNLKAIERILSGEITAQELAEKMADREVELENRADHDGLTGLLNYQGFMDALTEDLTIIHQYDLPAYLGFFDGDKLKEINDTVGKLAGNKIIQTYAQVLMQTASSRPHLASLIGRFGGDEFMILVIGASRNEISEMFEELRRSVPEAVKEALNMPDLNNTISIGVIKVGPHDNAATIIKNADANLRKAKKDRNKLVFD